MEACLCSTKVLFGEYNIVLSGSCYGNLQWISNFVFKHKHVVAFCFHHLLGISWVMILPWDVFAEIQYMLSNFFMFFFLHHH